MIPRKGIFVTESHYAVDIVDDLQYDSIYHEHLRFYLVKPLVYFMEKHGFKIIDAVRIPNYRGSIRITATLNKNIKPNNSVKRILDYEKKEVFILNQNTSSLEMILLKVKINY